MHNNKSILLLLLFIAFVLLLPTRCRNRPSSLQYPIDVSLYMDSLGMYKNYDPEYGPNLILKVRNTGRDFITINERGNIYQTFVPTYNQRVYLKGDINGLRPVSINSNMEYGFLKINTYDTLWPNQEKTYLFEPFHGRIFRDSVSFLLIQLPIESPYFDSLNQNMPFVFLFDLSYFYPENLRQNSTGHFSEIVYRHPFFVFSTADSLRLIDTTNAFIRKGLLRPPSAPPSKK